MNPDTNKLEPVFEELQEQLQRDELERVKRQLEEHQRRESEHPVDLCEKGRIGLLRADGTPVPDHWPIFKVGEQVVLKDYRFRIGHISATTLLLEPIGRDALGDPEERRRERNRRRNRRQKAIR